MLFLYFSLIILVNTRFISVADFFSFSPTWLVCIVFAVLFWPMRKDISKVKIYSEFEGFYLAYIVWSAFSAFFGADLFLGFKRLGSVIIVYICLYKSLFLNMQTVPKERLPQVLYSLYYPMAISLGVSLLFVNSPTGWQSAVVGLQEWENQRFIGIFPDHSSMGFLASICLLLSIRFLMKKEKRVRFFFNATVATLSGYLLFLTNNRGAMAGVFVALAVWFICDKKRSPRFFALTALCLAILITLFLKSTDQISEYFRYDLDDVDGFSSGRVYIAGQVLGEISGRWSVGSGPGSAVLLPFPLDGSYVAALYETGVVGLILMVLYTSLGIWAAFRRWRLLSLNGVDDGGLMLSLVLVITCIAVQSMFQNVVFYSSILGGQVFIVLVLLSQTLIPLRKSILPKGRLIQATGRGQRIGRL